METFSVSLGIQTIDKKTFDKDVVQLVEERRTDWKKFLEVSQLRVQEVNGMVDSPFLNDDIHIGVPYDWTWQKPG